ncbi:helix-turn-helix transcriptional regulator [Alicyclobacillus sendaiensis]|uniref:helix-turn-helix transcriptional regulator n=1 Tax=Alicyclobacillus sendaiensis TaxID=192387 RepID=UPI0009F8E5A9|nr:helix-turn-helix transcriptional regulator [Alicyclobacillus sendaiensis]
MLYSRLREARIARNMKPSDVAKAVGITERAYRYIEAGERVPSLETAIKLEQVLGIPPRELLVQSNSTSEPGSEQGEHTA